MFPGGPCRSDDDIIIFKTLEVADQMNVFLRKLKALQQLEFLANVIGQYTNFVPFGEGFQLQKSLDRFDLAGVNDGLTAFGFPPLHVYVEARNLSHF